MKKFFYIGWIAFICFGQVGYSQNSRIIETVEGKWVRRAEIPEGMTVEKIDEHSYFVHNEIETENLPPDTRADHNLTIYLEGEWQQLYLFGKGISEMIWFFEVPNNVYEVSLPEGYYDIMIYGVIPDGGYYVYQAGFLFYDQLLVDSDTELHTSMNDAIHKVEFELMDADGNLFGVQEAFAEIDLCWNNNENDAGFVWLINPNIEDFHNFYFFVNDVGMESRKKILLKFIILTEENDLYFYTFSPNSITEDIVLQNTSDDLYHYTQMFNTTEENTGNSFYGVFNLCGMYNELVDDFETLSVDVYYPEYKYEEDKPYSLYTNIHLKNDGPQSGFIKNFFSPIFYDFYEENNPYIGEVRPSLMAINENGELVADFFSIIYNGSYIDGIKEGKGICNNPLTKILDKDEFYYEGYRTPHLYCQSLNGNAFGNRQVMENLIFMGEYNEQKYNHDDVMVKLWGDGNEIFNDNIYKFNNYEFLDNSLTYQIEVTNKEVFAYGRNMINHTVIDFDMSKSDVTPPTLTMLRVIDNEKISMFVEHASTARLEITAGDYTYEDYALLYDKKPSIEVAWSSDGATFFALPVEEDASKFYKTYGNFFSVSLAPLAETDLEEAWISIRIVVTDDAGNRQEQILDPLFHYTASCNPVTDLKVEIAANPCAATLSWTAAADMPGAKYNVYRDGTKIASDLPETEYMDDEFEMEDEHTWTVKTICIDGESEGVAVTGECSVGIVETDNYQSLRIYPNPTTGLLTICDMRYATYDIGQSAIEIFDVLGRSVHVETRHATSLQSEIGQSEIGQSQIGQSEIGQSQITFDLSNVPTGIYFVRITTETGVVMRKVVKQ